MALRPLGPHERPLALRVASAVALALAIAVLAGAATVRDLSGHGGSIPAGIFIACVFLALAWGMHGRRYWAVLGFEALLAFQVIVTSLALIVADTLLAAGLCALSIGLAGWLFWKLVRVMGRIQAGEQAPRAGGRASRAGERASQAGERASRACRQASRASEQETDEALR